jgi:hypothetical protein
MNNVGFWHTQGVLFNNKKNEIMSIAGKWMELDIIILSDIRQTQKDKYCTFSLICGIQKKKTHQSITKTIRRDKKVPRGEGGEKKRKLEGSQRCSNMLYACMKMSH